MSKKCVAILGKLPPPFMGPAIATSVILNSGLKDRFELVHVDTKAYDSLLSLGKWSFRKLFRNISIYLKYIRTIRVRKPDLILIPVSQTTLGFLKDSFFIIIGKTFGRKILVQLRGSGFKNWIDGTNSMVRWFVKNTLDGTSGVIVLGEKLKYLFQDFYDDDRIFVVPNGADYEIKPAAKNDELILTYLGNLQPTKGIEDVIEAVSILHSKASEPFILKVQGSWRNENTRQKLLKKVESEKLPVQFLGPANTEDKFRLLAATDIFIFPPRAPEGHPWVIIEAMSAGLPIISTDKGAITESVVNGENGFIVKDSEPDELAMRISTLLGDEDLRQQMGSRSRARYEQYFTESKMVTNYTAVFNSVLDS